MTAIPEAPKAEEMATCGPKESNAQRMTCPGVQASVACCRSTIRCLKSSLSVTWLTWLLLCLRLLRLGEIENPPPECSGGGSIRVASYDRIFRSATPSRQNRRIRNNNTRSLLWDSGC